MDRNDLRVALVEGIDKLLGRSWFLSSQQVRILKAQRLFWTQNDVAVDGLLSTLNTLPVTHEVPMEKSQMSRAREDLTSAGCPPDVCESVVNAGLDFSIIAKLMTLAQQYGPMVWALVQDLLAAFKTPPVPVPVPQK